MCSLYFLRSFFVILSFFPIFSYSQLSGNYTIGGTSPSYPTLNAAVTDLMANGVSGPVSFKIRTGVYTEQILIPGSVSGASSVNLITFQSESGDSTDVTIQFNGVVCNLDSYVRLKSLTLTTTSNVMSTVIEAFFTPMLRIENCVVNAPNALSGYIINGTPDNILISFTDVNASSAADQVVISCLTMEMSNCNVSCSLRVDADSALINGNNLLGTIDLNCYKAGCLDNSHTGGVIDAITVVYNNNISGSLDVFANKLHGSGNIVNGIMDFFSVDTILLSGNYIRKLMLFSANGRDTIQGNTIDTVDIRTQFLFFEKNLADIGDFNYIQELYFHRNKIREVSFNYIDHIRIRNNYISEYFNMGYVDSTADIFHNNITAGVPNIIFGFNIPVVKLFNNNLLSPTFINMGTIFNRDYNNYWLTPGSEPNSINVDPQYISPQDIHAQNPGLIGTGLFIPSVGIDIDSNLRPNPPTIGANELNILTGFPVKSKPIEMVIYPNPSDDECVRLSCNKRILFNEKLFFEIADISGRVIQLIPAGGNNSSSSLCEKFAPGIYLVILRSESTVFDQQRLVRLK